CSPLYTGDDLYLLDSYGLSLLTNPFVIALDQAGRVAKQIQSGNSQVWSTDNGDGTRTVGLYNLAGSTANVGVTWSAIGLSGNLQVHDVWANTDTMANGSYSASLAAHACRLIKVSAPHIISLDFVGGGTAMGGAETAGAVGVVNWNSVLGQTGSGAGLIDSAGASTGASASWNASSIYSTGITDTAGGKRMMKGYLDTYSGSTTTVTVSGLPGYYTSHGYDVYVYSDGSNGGASRVYKYTIGASSVQVTDAVNTDFNGTYTQANGSAGNYARFGTLNGSSFTLSATPVSSTDAYLRAPINGVQIVGH
ncbi:MAG: hypothetical protein JWQ02_653, partial [Capsulimonas sp.]|nr:hypothetical protein [Capsulimonas sp.]